VSTNIVYRAWSAYNSPSDHRNLLKEMHTAIRKPPMLHEVDRGDARKVHGQLPLSAHCLPGLVFKTV